MQSWLDQDLEFLIEAVVRTVFMDVSDPNRALADIITMRDAGRPGVSPVYTWPVVREGGEWRAGFPYGLSDERCPFSAYIRPSEPNGGERDFPKIPGLGPWDRREDILASVPGTRVVHGTYTSENFGSSFSTGGSMSGYSDQINILAEIRTDLAGCRVGAPLQRPVLGIQVGIFSMEGDSR